MKKWAIISLIVMLILSGLSGCVDNKAGIAEIFSYTFGDTGTYENSLVSSNIESNNTKEIYSINSANINKTTILKTRYGDNITDSPKSKVIIKTYRKTVEFPELEKIIAMSIIIIVATIKLLVMKND